MLHPEHGVDLESAALAWYQGGITAQLFCSIRTHVDRTVVVTGTHGLLRLPAGFLPGRMDRYGGAPRIILERHGESAREIRIEAPGGLYGTEADAVVDHVRAGRTEAPEMMWEDSLANMAVLDRWRVEVGVRYDPAVEGPSAT